MHLCNSLKTQNVSLKSKSPNTYEAVELPDGTLGRKPFNASPVSKNADSFTVSNQLKTGVKYDAPQSPFFKQSALDAADAVMASSAALDKLPEPTSEPTPEPTPEPTSEPTPEPTPEPTKS